MAAANVETVDDSVLRAVQEVVPSCTREVLQAALLQHAGNANAAVSRLLDGNCDGDVAAHTVTTSSSAEDEVVAAANSGVGDVVASVDGLAEGVATAVDPTVPTTSSAGAGSANVAAGVTDTRRGGIASSDGRNAVSDGVGCGSTVTVVTVANGSVGSANVGIPGSGAHGSSSSSSVSRAVSAACIVDGVNEVPSGELSVSVEHSRTCALCFHEAAACLAVRLGCQHGWYCTECIRRHATARVEAGAADVCCPECGAPISERHLRMLLPSKLIDQLLSRSLSRLGNLRQCPTPDCLGLVALEDGRLPRFDCPYCKKESCLKCSAQPYHEGKTCEEHARKRKREDNDEEVFRLWMESTGTKQCPSCSSAVSKENLERQESQAEECHKMICRHCGTRFCFQCLAILTSTSTCGCSPDAHGFIDPKTGRFVQHLTSKAQRDLRPRGKGKWTSGPISSPRR
eukprot:TRINITY_DN40181_c0_g1_i1.p1 TRINITY_DN40181_c0_g1~~TRINITY_DN40181_c0_g1_i1.p1  ORF type:complete len:466 (+),score=57.29 TRINITY_DN40181_c0_g1_i1:29-1399(+)